MKAEISKADGVKCPRCYHYSHSMNFDCLCNRCVAIICKYHKEHESYAGIMENLELRGLSQEDNPQWNNV